MAAEELPKYTVVEAAAGDIEIRDYAPMLVAEVVVEGDRDTAANEGFRILAGFIFGGNQSSAKVAMTAPVTQTPSETIAMTAPVTQTPSDGGNWTISFMMPSKFTRETLPVPDDKRIVIRETLPRRAAARRFSGRWTKDNLAKNAMLLDAFITERQLKPDGPSFFAFYNGPFTPFFMRRNEVIVFLAP